MFIRYPLIAMRDAIIYVSLPQVIGVQRKVSQLAIAQALAESSPGDPPKVVFVQQKVPIDLPAESDLYAVGTLALIHAVRIDGDSLECFVRGVARVKLLISKPTQRRSDPWTAMAMRLRELDASDPIVEARVRSLLLECADRFQGLAGDDLAMRHHLDELHGSALADFAALYLLHHHKSPAERQPFLETIDVAERLEMARRALTAWRDSLEVPTPSGTAVN